MIIYGNIKNNYFQNICLEGEMFEDPFDSDDDVTNDSDGDGKSYYKCEKNPTTGRNQLVKKNCEVNEFFVEGRCTEIKLEPQGKKPVQDSLGVEPNLWPIK